MPNEIRVNKIFLFIFFYLPRYSSVFNRGGGVLAGGGVLTGVAFTAGFGVPSVTVFVPLLLFTSGTVAVFELSSVFVPTGISTVGDGEAVATGLGDGVGTAAA